MQETPQFNPNEIVFGSTTFRVGDIIKPRQQENAVREWMIKAIDHERKTVNAWTKVGTQNMSRDFALGTFDKVIFM